MAHFLDTTAEFLGSVKDTRSVQIRMVNPGAFTLRLRWSNSRIWDWHELYGSWLLNMCHPPWTRRIHRFSFVWNMIAF